MLIYTSARYSSTEIDHDSNRARLYTNCSERSLEDESKAPDESSGIVKRGPWNESENSVGYASVLE